MLKETDCETERKQKKNSNLISQVCLVTYYGHYDNFKFNLNKPRVIASMKSLAI